MLRYRNDVLPGLEENGKSGGPPGPWIKNSAPHAGAIPDDSACVWPLRSGSPGALPGITASSPNRRWRGQLSWSRKIGQGYKLYPVTRRTGFYGQGNSQTVHG